MAYPDKKALVRRRKAELQEEEKDKKLAFHYYQGTLNHKKELENLRNQWILLVSAIKGLVWSKA